MKCKQYPTTQFLRASEMTKNYSDCTSGPETCDNKSELNFESDYSEAFSIQTDDEIDAPIDSEVFIKTYNQQGHYATKQSLEKLLGPFAATYLNQTHAITVFQIIGSILIIATGFMYLSWILIHSDMKQVSLFEFVIPDGHEHAQTNLVQTANSVGLSLAQIFADAI